MIKLESSIRYHAIEAFQKAKGITIPIVAREQMQEKISRYSHCTRRNI